MEQVKIGWGRRSIAMEGPVSIPGQMYDRISEGIHDQVYATALCIDGGEGQDAVIFCSCDMVSVRQTGYNATLEALKRKNAPFPLEWVVMSATHTHAGIDTGDIGDTTPDGAHMTPGKETREFFAERASEAILEAWNNRKSGKLSFGYGYAVVGHSRRCVYFDDVSRRLPNPVSPNGHGVMYGKTNDDQFSHYEAGADHTLNAVYTYDANDKLTGIVANVPCPSQLSEHFLKLSGDYWNEVRENVKAEFGEDVYVLPQCAAAGDLSPRTLHYMEAQARRMRLKFGISYEVDSRYGHGAAMDDAGRISQDHYNKVIAERKDIAERITEGLKEICEWASKEKYDRLPVKHTREVMQLDRRMITDEEEAWCHANLEYMSKQPMKYSEGMEYRMEKTMLNHITERNLGAIQRYKDQKETGTYPMGVHVIQVGDIAFATTPTELYMDYMHRIQARSPFIQTFIVQLCGDSSGCYLATERGVASKGYSATIFDNMYTPEGGQQFVEGVLEILNGYKK